MSGLPPRFGSWSRHWDPSTELHFYYNSRSGLTTWDKPNPLDPPYLPGRFKDRNVPEHFEDRQYVVQPPTRRTAEPPDGGARRWESSHMYGRTRSRKKRLPPLKRTRRYQERKQEEDSPRKVLVLIFPPHDGEYFEAYQDYLKLADEYTMTAPYRETGGDQSCVLCQTRKASHVFFPCEHKCVCGRCAKKEGFGEEGGDGGGHLCPVCCQQVAFVVPYKGGNEAAQYWRWVQEVKPTLPRGFRHKFHMAAIMLKIKSEPDSHETWDRPSSSACCVLS